MIVYNVVYLILGFLGILKNPQYSDTDDSRCSLTVDNGTAYCQDVGRGEVACNVLCDGANQGLYRCSQDQGWDKQLPHCVSDFKDLSRVAKCRDDEVYSECRGHCHRSCLNQDQPLTCASNICVGACVCGEGYVRRPDGTCEPENTCTTPEKPSAEATECNPTRCSTDCSYLHLGGKCIDGACKCGYKAPERTSPEATECDLGRCVTSCSSMFLSGTCKNGNCECSRYAPERTPPEATACKNDACAMLCSSMFLSGRCKGGKCACSRYASERTSAEATACDNTACAVFCANKRLLGTCHNGKCECIFPGSEQPSSPSE